jgi:quercetin dioxygenase-like cupin family protein
MTQTMLLVKAGENRSPEQPLSAVKLTSSDTQGAYVLVELHVRPEAVPTNLEVQSGQRAYYVVQGDVAFHCHEAATLLAHEGDVVLLSARDTCRYELVGDAPGVLLALLVPVDIQGSRHIKANEGRSLRVITDIGTFKLTGGDTGGAYLLMEWRVPPQGGVPMHAQAGQETFYIVEGSFSFRGRRPSDEHYTLLAERGDTIHVGERVPHSYKNIGNGPGRMLVLMAPAGRARQFFEEIGTPVEDAASFLAPASLPDPATLVATLQKYQVDFSF